MPILAIARFRQGSGKTPDAGCVSVFPPRPPAALWRTVERFPGDDSAFGPAPAPPPPGFYPPEKATKQGCPLPQYLSRCKPVLRHATSILQRIRRDGATETALVGLRGDTTNRGEHATFDGGAEWFDFHPGAVGCSCRGCCWDPRPNRSGYVLLPTQWQAVYRPAVCTIGLRHARFRC